MAATAAEIARLRRMVAEPSTTTYDDASIEDYIERNPVEDSEGYQPDDTGWTATYDLHAAAAEIWEEKAAALADHMDFNADGGSFNASQLHENAMRQAVFHRARARVTSIEHSTYPTLTDVKQDDEEYANIVGDS